MLLGRFLKSFSCLYIIRMGINFYAESKFQVNNCYNILFQLYSIAISSCCTSSFFLTPVLKTRHFVAALRLTVNATLAS